jgi:hypothetical protein
MMHDRQRRFSTCDFREIEAKVQKFSRERGEIGIDSFLLLVMMLYEATVRTNVRHASVVAMDTFNAAFGMNPFKLRTPEGAAEVIQFHARRWIAFSRLGREQRRASVALKYLPSLISDT